MTTATATPPIDRPEHSATEPGRRDADTRPTFSILIDGDCPLCKHEANLLARMDRGRGRLELVDIAADDFDPTNYGRTQDELMAKIHGVTSDGELIEGMEVFRRAYRAAGWGWVMGWTGWPIVRPVADAAYRWFAKHRLRLTGRSCTAGSCTPRA